MPNFLDPSTTIGALVIGIISGLISGVIIGFFSGKTYERYSTEKKKNKANVKGDGNVVIQDSKIGGN